MSALRPRTPSRFWRRTGASASALATVQRLLADAILPLRGGHPALTFRGIERI